MTAVALTSVAHAAPRRSATAALGSSRHDLPFDVRYDQYYTQHEVASRMYDIFREHVDVDLHRLIEPSAGTGSFLRLLPPGSIGIDIDPKSPGIRRADFLTIQIEPGRNAIIGNPPFGKNSSMARNFFNHAAWQVDFIGFILPRTFRKFKMQNSLDRAFHLLHEEGVPKWAFLFRGRPFNVPAVFQIWERRGEQRPLWPTETRHPDFEFTTPDRADFAIQRVGAGAGQVHHNFRASRSSHHFIRGPVEWIMSQIDFAEIANNVAGNPCISMSEIIYLYRRWIDLNCPWLGNGRSDQVG